jgi:hypothetical protein
MSKEKASSQKAEKNSPMRASNPVGSDLRTEFPLGNFSFFNARNFKIVATALFIGMIFMSRHYGINGDEKFQVDYSKKLWNYYASLGKDTSALYIQEGQIHLYGGLFDIVAIALDKVLGFDDELKPEYHTVRRVLCAVFGFITILFASLFAKRVGGWPLAFITLVLMALSPRFLGDSMVNPKDIPFAAGFIIGLYYIARFIRQLPKPEISSMIGIVAGTMIALGSRAGGLLLLVYFFLFVGIYLAHTIIKKQVFNRSLVKTSLNYTLITGLAAYLAGIVFWPYALANPWTHPLKALAEFTHQPIALPVLFKGQHILNTQLPLNYLPEWIIRTIPLTVIVGIFFFLRNYFSRSKAVPMLETGMMMFSFIFPLWYAMYKHSSLHDGWRHFIFVYPSIVVLAALGWSLWLSSSRTITSRRLYLVLLVLLLSENIYAIFTLHPYQYAYFNPLFGGLKKAYGNFETDYWMLSIKEASKWLKQHEHIGSGGKSCVIATNCMYPATIYLNDPAKGIRTDYVRYYERSEHRWDYALYYSRFVDRSQLLNLTWPPKGTIHTIEADGIPLCAIVRRENIEDYLGFESVAKNDVNGSIEHFNNALIYDPDNERVSLALSLIYLKIGQLDLADKAIRQSLKVYPDNPASINAFNSIQAERQKGH